MKSPIRHHRHSKSRGISRRTIAGSALAVLMATSSAASAGALDTPIADAELNAQRGREGTTFVDLTAATSQLEGQSTNNVASGNRNGANIIDGAAFSGLNGHATVIQNSGNNNVIQDSTIYNFSLSP